MSQNHDVKVVVDLDWMNVAECLASWPDDKEMIPVKTNLSSLYCPEVLLFTALYLAQADSLRLCFLFLNVKKYLSPLFAVFYSRWNLKKMQDSGTSLY